MPQVTINIAGRGARLAGGGTSAVGHMWYSLKSDSGQVDSFGFSPDAAHQGDPFAPGQVNVHGSDDAFYLDKEYSASMNITQAQYDAMLNFGRNPASGKFDMQYNGMTNSCIDFTWRALSVAGLNPLHSQGSVWPTWNIISVMGILPFKWVDPKQAIDQGRLDPKTLLPIVHKDTTTNWQKSHVPPRRDPLAVDLDGDGIETSGIPSSGSAILFDHDADRVKTGTGWLNSDDAWLTLDRDGNGAIESGRELFGVDSLITVEETRTNPSTGATYVATVTRSARTGFEALRTLDTGSGTAGSAGYRDGVFDSRDAQFANVRLWRDLNQDGISQSPELKTLMESGIASIALNETAVTTDLGNGNTITGKAVVTRTGGSTTEIESVDLQAGNLNLASNPFYREFTDTIPLTDAARALPEMGGSGWLRDLREAMSLAGASASELVSALNSYKSTTSRDLQLAQLDGLILKWAATTGRVDTFEIRAVTSTVVEETSSTQTMRRTTVDPSFYATFDANNNIAHCVHIQLEGDHYYRLEPDGFGGVTKKLTDEGREVFLTSRRCLAKSRKRDCARFIPCSPGGATATSLARIWETAVVSQTSSL